MIITMVIVVVANIISSASKAKTQQAAEWEKAAETGSRNAQFKIGTAYYMGTAGVVQDFGKAIRWFREAAERGDPDGQYNLGLMYGKGQGMPTPDMVSAYMWILIAAKSGNTTAQSTSKIFETKISAEQIAEGKHRASQFEHKR